MMKKLMMCFILSMFVISCGSSLTIKEKEELTVNLIESVGYDCKRVKSLGEKTSYGKRDTIQKVICTNGGVFYIKRDAYLDWMEVCHKGVCKKI